MIGYLKNLFGIEPKLSGEKMTVRNLQGYEFEIPVEKKREWDGLCGENPPQVMSGGIVICPHWAKPIYTEKQVHEQCLRALSQQCRAIVQLVDGHFQPENIMAWRDDEEGPPWEVFIRRKGSDEQFTAAAWNRDLFAAGRVEELEASQDE